MYDAAIIPAVYRSNSPPDAQGGKSRYPLCTNGFKPLLVGEEVDTDSDNAIIPTVYRSNTPPDAQGGKSRYPLCTNGFKPLLVGEGGDTDNGDAAVISAVYRSNSPPDAQGKKTRYPLCANGFKPLPVGGDVDADSKDAVTERKNSLGCLYRSYTRMEESFQAKSAFLCAEQRQRSLRYLSAMRAAVEEKERACDRRRRLLLSEMSLDNHVKGEKNIIHLDCLGKEPV